MYPQNTIYDVHEVLFRFSAAPAVGTPYYFPQDGHIKKNIFRAVQCVRPTLAETSYEIPATLPVGSGTTLTAFTDAQLKNTFLTLALVKSNGEPDNFIEKMPLWNLVRYNNNSRIPEFRRRIDITKSYLTFTDVTDITTSVFILFYFHLEPIPTPQK